MEKITSTKTTKVFKKSRILTSIKVRNLRLPHMLIQLKHITLIQEEYLVVTQQAIMCRQEQIRSRKNI